MEQEKDREYMRRALELAGQAAALGETPIGALIVYEDKIIGQGFNLRNTKGNPL